jgi:D-alanine-D-alanine ligase
LVVCDIDFACRLFGDPAIEAALVDGRGEFLRHVIAEARARHARGLPRYSRRGDASVGFGIFADVAIAAGEVVFAGEERGQRIVTRGHVEGRWSAAAMDDFQAYAYPLSEEVFILWDRDPGAWAPQNHSCDPNTRYRGLDVVALRDIAAGEELTFDYADCYNEAITPFACKCGSANCRGWVAAPAGNSVTRRERARHGR